MCQGAMKTVENDEWNVVRLSCCYKPSTKTLTNYLTVEKRRLRRWWPIVSWKTEDQNVDYYLYCREMSTRTALIYLIFVIHQWPRGYQTYPIILYRENYQKLSFENTGHRAKFLWAAPEFVEVVFCTHCKCHTLCIAGKNTEVDDNWSELYHRS